MPRRATADYPIMRGLGVAAGVAGHRFTYADYMLEHTLHAPKAASGENGNLASRFSLSLVGYWRWQRANTLGSGT